MGEILCRVLHIASTRKHYTKYSINPIFKKSLQKKRPFRGESIITQPPLIVKFFLSLFYIFPHFAQALKHILLKRLKGVFFMFELLLRLATSIYYFALHVTSNGSFPPPLSAAEERELLEKSRNGDIEARNLLIWTPETS